MEISVTENCGVRELNGIASVSAQGAVESVAYEFNEDFVFVIFTDISESEKGADLATFIRKNKLGPIIQTREAVNPNTDNLIRVWVWQIDAKNLKKFDRGGNY